MQASAETSPTVGNVGPTPGLSVGVELSSVVAPRDCQLGNCRCPPVYGHGGLVSGVSGGPRLARPMAR
jgi:hypothetical protein